MSGAKPPPGLPGDPGILALGVDDQDGAVHAQKVRDHRPDAFPGPCRGEGDQMGGTVIAQQPTGPRIAPDQQTITTLKFFQLLAAGKAGRPMTVPSQPRD